MTAALSGTTEKATNANRYFIGIVFPRNPEKKNQPIFHVSGRPYYEFKFSRGTITITETK